MWTSRNSDTTKTYSWYTTFYSSFFFAFDPCFTLWFNSLLSMSFQCVLFNAKIIRYLFCRVHSCFYLSCVDLHNARTSFTFCRRTRNRKKKTMNYQYYQWTMCVHKNLEIHNSKKKKIEIFNFEEQNIMFQKISKLLYFGLYICVSTVQRTIHETTEND